MNYIYKYEYFFYIEVFRNDRFLLDTYIYVIFGMIMKLFIIIYILIYYDLKFCVELIVDLRFIDIKLEVFFYDVFRSKFNKYRGYVYIFRV